MGWRLRRKRELFYKKAKAEKYKARSAYKLLELQKKFKIIKQGDVVIDLGAAPGSWSQVALEFVGRSGLVIGVDVKRVFERSPNYKFVQGDLRKPTTLEKIRQALPRRADVVLCDAAPEFSGIKIKDMGEAAELGFGALELARKLLKPKGNFVVKAFRGPDYKDLLSEIKRTFAVVKEAKPSASLRSSAEIYIVALRKASNPRP